MMSADEIDRPVSYFRVEIYRPGAEIETFAAAGNEIAGLAAALGQIQSIAPSASIESKFGRFATAELSIVHNNETRHCFGFVRSFDEPRLQIAGLYCKPEGEITDRAALACALDRLTLVSAGSDAKTAELFARAELKRTFCGQKSPFLYATPRRSDWTAGGPEARLRGRIAER
jgi:hypothetical protein